MWVLSAFSKSGNCNFVCVRVRVFCFGFFPLDKQLLQAILHLSTLELSIEMAQTKKEETHTHKNNSNKGKKSKLQALEQMSNFSPAVTSNNSCSFLFRQFELLPVFCLFFFSLKTHVTVHIFFFFVHTDSLINKTLKMSSKKVVLTDRTIASVAV